MKNYKINFMIAGALVVSAIAFWAPVPAAAQVYEYAAFFPYEQKVAPLQNAEFDESANPAKLVYDEDSGDSGLSASQIGCRVELAINSDDICEIVVKGLKPVPVSASFSFTTDDSGRSRIKAFKDDYTGYAVYLEPAGTKTFAPGRYAALMLPAELREGFRLIFRNSAGRFAETVIPDPVKLTAGGVVDLGEIDTQALFWEEALQLRFLKAEGKTDGMYWPFKSPGKNPFPLSVKDEWQFKYTGKRYKLGTQEKSNVYLFASDYIAPHWSYGLRFGAKVGDYIELPGRPGKVIYKVKYITGTKGSEGSNPSIWTANDAPRRVRGGEGWKGRKNRGDEKVWMLSGLKPGEGCRLTTTKGSNACVWEVDVYYANPADLTKNAVSAVISGEADNIGNKGVFKGGFTPAFACDISKFSGGIQYRQKGESEWKDLPWNEAGTDFEANARLEYDTPYEYRAYARGEDNDAVLYGNVRTIVPEARVELNLKLNDGIKPGAGSILDGSGLRDNCSSTTEKWRGREYSFKLGTEYTFRGWGSVGFAASTSGGLVNGIRVNTYQSYKGQLYGTNTGEERAWFQMPEIPGFSLVGMEVAVNCKDADFVLSAEKDGREPLDESCSYLGRSSGKLTFTPQNAEPGKGYYLCMKGYNIVITNIKLKYIRK